MQEKRQGSLHPGHDLHEAQEIDPEMRSRQLQDSLLTSFSVAQKEYIVDNLYPDIQRAFVHFIAEAKRMNKI